MMIAGDFFNMPVDFTDGKISVLVIENKKIFRKILQSFCDGTVDERLVFSHDFKPFDFDKRGFFIANILDLDFQNKRLASKINSIMQQTAVNDYSEDLLLIKAHLMTLFDKLNELYDFEYSSDFEIDFSSILKLLRFEIDTSLSDLSELLVSYILLINKYFKLDLFVIHSVYDYFDFDEIEAMYKTLALHHINVLVVTSSKPKIVSEFEQIYIVDSDLCVINNG